MNPLLPCYWSQCFIMATEWNLEQNLVPDKWGVAGMNMIMGLFMPFDQFVLEFLKTMGLLKLYCVIYYDLNMRYCG